MEDTNISIYYLNQRRGCQRYKGAGHKPKSEEREKESPKGLVVVNGQRNDQTPGEIIQPITVHVRENAARN
jgi:hypothetical protein